MVIQFNLRAFFSVRTWPWMMLFYKLRPLLRSAQVEKELAALNEEFKKLKEAFDRSDCCLYPVSDYSNFRSVLKRQMSLLSTFVSILHLQFVVSPSGQR